MRRRLLALATSAVLPLAAVTATAPAAQSSTSATAVVASALVPSVAGTFRLAAAKVNPGATVRVWGALPPTRARRVVLQRHTGSRWVKVSAKRSGPRGGFEFRFAAGAQARVVPLRVWAPAARIEGRRLRALATPTRRLTVLARTPTPTQTPTPTPIPAVVPGTTLRITTGTGPSWSPAISGDGRYVSFFSGSSDLVPGGVNRGRDVFVFDRAAGAMSRITDGGRDSTNPSLSRDGQSVVFMSAAGNLVPGDTNSQFNVYLHTLGSNTGKLTDQTVPTGPAVISADGWTIAYLSESRVLWDGHNPTDRDLFLYDRLTGKHRQITVGDADTYAPSLSADGRLLVFHSWADNLVPGDTNGAADIFIFDTATGQTRRLTNGNSNSTTPWISADGSYVVFDSAASNLVADDTNGRTDIFGVDLATGAISRLAAGNAGSFAPVSSADGRMVAFHSWASDLVPGDLNDQSDVFTLDRATGVLTRITGGSDDSRAAAISDDGQVITFVSDAPDLVPGDFNANPDVFVWTP